VTGIEYIDNDYMGHSFISYSDKTLRIRNHTFGILCGVIAYEITNLSHSSSLCSYVLPLLDLIVSKGYYYGYDTAFELDDFVKNNDDKQQMVMFVEQVINKLSSFGQFIPQEYLQSLLSAKSYPIETWRPIEIIEPLKDIVKILSDA
jgi:hypothetical protein